MTRDEIIEKVAEQLLPTTYEDSRELAIIQTRACLEAIEAAGFVVVEKGTPSTTEEMQAFFLSREFLDKVDEHIAQYYPGQFRKCNEIVPDPSITIHLKPTEEVNG